MPAAMSLAMSAATSARPMSTLGWVAEFLRARMAPLSFIKAVLGLSAGEAALYSAKSVLRFLRHIIVASSRDGLLMRWCGGTGNGFNRRARVGAIAYRRESDQIRGFAGPGQNGFACREGLQGQASARQCSTSFDRAVREAARFTVAADGSSPPTRR